MRKCTQYLDQKGSQTSDQSHFIRGIIVGRRCMGRHLAFADVAIINSLNEKISINNALKTVKLIFVRRTFRGPSPTANKDNMNEPFPTKMSSLPFGATIIAQLNNCNKEVSFSDREIPSTENELREVIRWEIVDHPKKLAEQLASLEISNTPYNSESRTESSGRALPYSSTQSQLWHINAPKDSYEPSENGHKVIIGSGALSYSTYLKIRGEAFDLANQYKIHSIENKKSSIGDSKLKDDHEGIVDSITLKYIIEPFLPTSNEPFKSCNTDFLFPQTPSSIPAGETVVSSSHKGTDTSYQLEVFHGDKYSKARRAKVFASWVLKTFFELSVADNTISNDSSHYSDVYCQKCATDLCSMGSAFSSSLDSMNSIFQNFHVLDIAGGKGKLSLELILLQEESIFNENGMYAQYVKRENNKILSCISRCTIVDPLVRKGDAKSRQSKLIRFQRHMQWKMQQRYEQSTVFIKPEKEAMEIKLKEKQGGRTEPQITHLATHFTAKSFSSMLKSIDELSHKSDFVTQPLQEKLLLLGLHPDQCTEDIVDVALKYDLSFAIVPCCVYPDIFISRNLTLEGSEINRDDVVGQETETSESTSVRTYQQFIEYLMTKDNRLQMTCLPFDGRNVVIYKV